MTTFMDLMRQPAQTTQTIVTEGNAPAVNEWQAAVDARVALHDAQNYRLEQSQFEAMQRKARES